MTNSELLELERMKREATLEQLVMDFFDDVLCKWRPQK